MLSSLTIFEVNLASELIAQPKCIPMSFSKYLRVLYGIANGRVYRIGLLRVTGGKHGVHSHLFQIH